MTLTLPRALIESALSLEAEPSRVELTDLASLILSDRQQRRSLFPKVRFGEPSWDMMLDLYVAEQEGRRPFVSDMYVAANVPRTTAVRHLESLIESGYMHREDDPTDGRRSFILTTEKMRGAVEAWLRLHWKRRKPHIE